MPRPSHHHHHHHYIPLPPPRPPSTLQRVADRLGLCGVARVEAFINAQSGDVVITDVDPQPHLGPEALVFKQVRLFNVYGWVAVGGWVVMR